MPKKVVTVPLSIMISEHKKTIKALKSDSPKERQDEIRKQSSQLKRYEKLNVKSKY